MFKDVKLLRQNSGKTQNLDEIENLPTSPNGRPPNQPSSGISRDPLLSIPDPTQTLKSGADKEVGFKSSAETTPTKPKGRGPDLPPFRTPEKQGNLTFGKKKFGWSAYESRNEIKTSSFQTTPTKSVCKPPNAGFAQMSLPRCPGTASSYSRRGSSAALSRGVPVLNGLPMLVNTVEVSHYDLKEDPSFWIHHNVQVIIRVRPLNSTERGAQGYNRCVKQESSHSITCVGATGQPEARFTFDHVACETVDQEMLFRKAGLPMVENCLSGYNSCMFAYGQTGSGKTYTMLGDIDGLEFKPSPNRGMTPRIFEYLFARIRAEEESRRDDQLKYSCKCSFLEIYNEQITDLLNPSSANLLLREDVRKGIYVENLSEFEVCSVCDILNLLAQGSLNRKVAATNMNKESSRSHCVFTCVIESKWERDSTNNVRFARLNLVDLAGSERQKTSGAEGERLKEAANINKSLSTLGHVIMVLVDVATGKIKHVPYRDSKLTFLLQESLGGNSKTIIIANISPSSGCAAETLNTLKFAQRAKLIQNNAIVNEDSSGEVSALQHTIRILKEELSALKKRQHVSRSLSFGPPSITYDIEDQEDVDMEIDQPMLEDSVQLETEMVNLSSQQQLKSLESIVAGALRREQFTETSIKKLEAEIECLNRLVHQREEDTRCSKMKLKFREDKIQRMESLLKGVKPVDSFLLEENAALLEEIRMLQEKVDRNPEVTRFALENIRLLEQVKRFQGFYEEGEREILLSEVSELRDKLIQLVDENNKQHLHSNIPMAPKESAKSSRENDSFHREPTVRERKENCDDLLSPAEELLNLELELDILKIILKEERSSCVKADELAACLSRELKLAEECILSTRKQYENVNGQLKEAKSITQELESSQQMTVNLLEGLQKQNEQYVELLRKQEIELVAFKQQTLHQVSNDYSVFKGGKLDETLFQLKLDKMHTSLEKAKMLNVSYQRDHASRKTSEEERDEVRQQVEEETAQVILCLQEELSALQQQVHDGSWIQKEVESRLTILQTTLSQQQDACDALICENEALREQIKGKEEDVKSILKEWEILESALTDGHDALVDASEQFDSICGYVPKKGRWIIEQVHKLTKKASEKELVIEELNVCLENANARLNDTDCMLRSLKGAALVITESHQKECSEKENEIHRLKRELSAKSTHNMEIESKISLACDEMKKSSKCATVAFVIVNRLSEINSGLLDALKYIEFQLKESIESNQMKDGLLDKCAVASEEAEIQTEALRKEQELTEERCNSLEDEHAKKQLVITEFLQKERNERDKEIHRLKSELSAKSTANMEIESKISLTCDEMKKASKCATVAFVMVNRLSEINSSHLDGLKHIVFQLNESVESNQMKDGLLEKCAVATEEAERQIEALKKELDLAKESCNRLGDEIAKQQVYISVTERQLEEYHELDILKTKERLSLLQEGVSTVKSCMNNYAKQSKRSTEISVVVDGSKDTRLDEHVQTFEACSNTSLIHEDSKENVKSTKSLKGGTSKDATIILLRNEIELALESLKEVQAVVDRLHAEKQELSISERQSCEGMEVVRTQLCHIQAAFGDFEDQWHHKMKALNQKLEKAEQHAEEASRCWCQAKEIFEGELSNATIDIAKRTAEASCLFSKFEEAQDIMKEADVMIKGLMISNETLKLQIEDLKRENLNLSCERDGLIQDIESLHSYTELDNRKCHELIEQLEITLSQARGSSEEAFFSLSSDISSFKYQFLNSRMLIQSWLEDACSEIIVEGSAVSVLNLCHIRILLEAVTRLNAENCLLQNGLCESNVTISHLREQNMRSVRELESFHILKAKLLAAIKRSSDCITTTEAETEELGAKLRVFESKITDLQLQEEQMLERSNYLVFELANLVKDLNQSNSDVLTSLLEQETLLNDNKEAAASQAENLYTELSAKDLELLIMTSELQQLADEKAKMGTEHISFCKVLEHLRKEVITVSFSSSFTEQLLFETDAEVNHLQKEIGEVNLLWTQSCGDMISLDVISTFLKEELILQKEITCLNEKQNYELHEVLQEKDSELMSCQGQIQNLSLENCRLQESIHDVESNNTFLQGDLYLRKADLEKLQYSHSSTNEKLCQKSLELQNHLTKMNAIEEENMSLKEELRCLQLSQYEALRLSSCSAAKCLNLTESAEMESHRMCSVLNEKIEILSEKLSQDNSEKIEVVIKIQEALEPLDTHVEDIISENFALKDELVRKDVVLNGLLFDLRLLQESASSTKDQRDEIEELTDSLKLKEEALNARSRELDDVVAGAVELQAQIEEKIVKISLFEGDLSTATNAVELLSKEKTDLTFHIEEISMGKVILERELVEKQKLVESFQIEVIDMENSISQLNASIESLKDELEEVSSDRDNLQTELLDLEEKIDTAQALAEEYEEIAMEAKQIAESRRIYGQEKEEEVRLLEKSVQELDRTVDVMENKVDILKEEAERQRLQREELEMELDSLKLQVHNLKSADSDIKRELDEKEQILQDTFTHVLKLEKDLANKDTEISRCNAHITELNLHAEAQASEYKKQFKALEAMAGQVKTEGHSSQGKSSSSNKLEKNASKPRGSGSPFKCIGLGLSQQMKLEKDEELTAERHRILELEALAANRQKEIFVLHNRLAAAESMTHDVIRDLLGVKLDMTNYVSMLDKQQVQKIAENAQLDNVNSGVKVEEIRKLKKLLSDFIEERKGWLEEIDRRQGELISTQLALEKLHQRDKSLTAENEVLKADIENYKKKIVELGGEVNKLSGQQNIHQQINHHAKIKEENNILKRQNEELSVRLQTAQTFLLRLRGKLARFPACDGVNMYTDLEEEKHLRNKLKETEEEKVQLAQVVLGLCSSILQAAGIKKQVSDINVALAEEALEQLRVRTTSLERELGNLRVKSRIENEKIRLSTIVLHSPPVRSGAEDNCITPTRNSQSPFFTVLDR